jgi:hypothetical protein
MEFFFEYLYNIDLDELKSMKNSQLMDLIDSYNKSNSYDNIIKIINVEMKLVNERIETLQYKYDKLIEEKWINIEKKKKKQDNLEHYNLDGDDIEYDVITDDINDEIMKFNELIEMLGYISSVVEEFL